MPPSSANESSGTRRRFLRGTPPEELPFPVRGYLIVNVLFDAFLVAVYFFARAKQSAITDGMVMPLVGLAICFALVSVYDGVYDRVMLARAKAQAAEPSRPAPPASSAPVSAAPEPTSPLPTKNPLP